jgi:hypothetical protein
MIHLGHGLFLKKAWNCVEHDLCKLHVLSPLPVIQAENLIFSVKVCFVVMARAGITA